MRAYNVKSWEGKEAVIIGGGPSLQKFDFQKLENLPNKYVTVGTNKSILAFNPSVNLIMDSKLVDEILYRKSKFTDAYNSYKGDSLFYNWGGKQKYPKNAILIEPKRKYSNVGLFAINVALQFGCKRIWLLGFDMQCEGEKTHWHEGYIHESVSSQERVFPTFIQDFNWLAENIKGTNITIFNTNPNSALKCFPIKRNFI